MNPHPNDASPGAGPSPTAAEATAERRLRVLVVDDIERSRQETCALVGEAGDQAFPVASGAAALEALSHQLPDLVLLDLWMPDMDGYEVTRRLREQVTDRWLPVIVTSSLEGEEHFAEALRRGADDYLTRPVNAGLLVAKLRNYRHVLGLQSRLEAAARRQRAISDNVLDAVLTFGADGRIEDANTAAAALLGLAHPAQLVGRQGERVLGLPLSALQGEAEVNLRRADGSRFPALVRSSDWQEQACRHTTIIVHDLTERQRAERLKDEFLATVSHELRTPLTSLVGALGLLAGGAAGALPAQGAQLAEVARRNGERLSRLIDDLLDLTKLEAQRLALNVRRVPIGRLVRDGVSSIRGMAERSGVVLSAEISALETEALADADRVAQVLANLLSNAIKHSPPGAVVRIAVETMADTVRVTVRDQGPGVDPQFRARMFEKFSQADGSDRRAQGGTGLGLYIARMLVEKMRGRIGVDSTTGAGAVFFFELPRADRTPEPAVPWLLYVDRDADACVRVGRLLAGVCAVETAADAAAATALARERAPSLVIADPQAQGTVDEFCRALRALARGRPIVLYSDAVDGRYARALDLAWLPKSGTGDRDLMTAVGDALAAEGSGR